MKRHNDLAASIAHGTLVFGMILAPAHAILSIVTHTRGFHLQAYATQQLTKQYHSGMAYASTRNPLLYNDLLVWHGVC